MRGSRLLPRVDDPRAVAGLCNSLHHEELLQQQPKVVTGNDDGGVCWFTPRNDEGLEAEHVEVNITDREEGVTPEFVPALLRAGDVLLDPLSQVTGFADQESTFSGMRAGSDGTFPLLYRWAP